MAKRALISVSDKTGIVEFAKELVSLNYEIISTGGTKKVLKEASIDVIGVSEITGFPECLDGRVKTLHPAIHAGVLAMRDNKEHMEKFVELNINPIDIVCIKLYPFKETNSKENVTFEDAIENIDIGGPTMIRAAAKNYQDVAVVVDPKDYTVIIDELKKNDKISLDTKLDLAYKVFEHTSSYDTMIAEYLRKTLKKSKFPQVLSMTYEKVQEMRYGENPHQKAAFYKEMFSEKGTLVNAKQIHGKELSFNNINDTDGALDTLKEFDEPTVVGVKHANPCGVGSAKNIYDAYIKAYNGDKESIFGGIIAANMEIDEKTAIEINKIFIEIVIAPSFSQKALEILMQKKNIRILELKDIGLKHEKDTTTLKKVAGGLLIQDLDTELIKDEINPVTNRKPTKEEMEDLIFAWKVVKHTKSNGISIAKDKMAIGVGPGQTSRVGALNVALDRAKGKTKGSVMASDAFFPFNDCVEMAHAAGITAIIQPGGSIRDQDSIDLCNKYNIAMVFTSMRHFKH